MLTSSISHGKLAQKTIASQSEISSIKATLNAIPPLRASYPQEKHMDSDTAQQLSNAIQSALNKILPDLVSLLQRYQIEGLELRLTDMDQLPPALGLNQIPILCTYWDAKCRCWKFCNPLVLGLDPEKTEQFCNELASELDRIVPLLGQSLPSLGDSYEVHLLLDSAMVVSQPTICRWSDTSQDNILECVNS